MAIRYNWRRYGKGMREHCNLSMEEFSKLMGFSITSLLRFEFGLEDADCYVTR